MNSGFIGVYDIKILTYRNIDYSNLDYNGKIIITEEGITIQTDLPTLDLLRGSYNPDISDEVNKGRFVCNISKGYGDFFITSINNEGKVGAVTVSNRGSNTTTTFTLK